MTIDQLREEVGFAAGIPDIDALGGWFDNELRSILDEYTALTKYDDLFVPNISITPNANSPIIALPDDLQHLDEANVQYWKGNDSNKAKYLEKFIPTGSNIGSPNSYVRVYDSAGLKLKIYPYVEITNSDRFIINYWRTLLISSDSTRIIPGMLGPVVRHELISRANAFIGDGKKFVTASELANKAFVRGMGTVPLQSQNE